MEGWENVDQSHIGQGTLHIRSIGINVGLF